ncbi:MAG: PspC domain-containing protein [Owenweeksia sp.]|nr:PspC domain-containing protein [Owenweeksia sp.]
MNKTLNINLAGLIFHIDEEAFYRLEKYLEVLKRQFSHTEGGNEIISDIETRIAELFKQKTSETKEVINDADVEAVIAIMGQPEDYLEAEEPELAVPPEEDYSKRAKRIFRDPDNRVFGGVSSGVAAYFNIDPIWVRLLFVILFFTGPGILVYIVMWLVVPKANTTVEKLQMRGEPVNITNIQRSIRDEMKGLGRGAQHFGQHRESGGMGGFLNNLGNFLADAFRLIFKLLFKLIGLFFLALGFLLLFAMLTSLIVGSIDISGTEYGVHHFFEFMRLVTENNSHYNLLMVALLLSVLAPLFLLIYFGIRILFNLDPLNRPTKTALGASTFIGLVLLLIAGVRIALQFDDGAQVQEKLKLSTNQEYYLEAQQDSIYKRFTDNYDMRWQQYAEFHAFNMVEIDVKETSEPEAYLSVIIKSNGEDRRDARKRAEELRYQVLIEDSVITIPTYYLLQKGEHFRAQRIEVILYLPPGTAVYLDENTADYLYGVKNLQNMWDYDMAGRLWHMNVNGLSCDACKIPEKENTTKPGDDPGNNSPDSLEIKDSIKGSMEVKIDRDEIEIYWQHSPRISFHGSSISQRQDALNVLQKRYHGII